MTPLLAENLGVHGREVSVTVDDKSPSPTTNQRAVKKILDSTFASTCPQNLCGVLFKGKIRPRVTEHSQSSDVL